MAYGLPTYGESGQTYTDKLNNSIEYVRSEAEAAQAAADAANQSIIATTETADEAKELAAASKSFVQGPTDSQVKQLVNDSTSQTNAALSATFAGISTYPRTYDLPAFTQPVDSDGAYSFTQNSSAFRSGYRAISAPGQWLEYEVLLTAGKWTLGMETLKAGSGGTFQVTLDGELVGTVDT
ncbi:MAG TPA: hypothetical protein VFI97_07505, partial [Arthrobacter sp.]|nr:hypothetical protein [Arthrobacter sp.]